LILHQRLPSGNCGGCLSFPTTWPCATAGIALRVLDEARQE
jgi:hypothetical protein